MADMSGGVIQLASVIEYLPSQNKDFANKIVDYFQKKGYVSEGYAKWIPKLLDIAENNRNPQEASGSISVRTGPKVENFERVISIFDTAKEKGYKKKIILRFGDDTLKVKLSEAPKTGMNAGMVYVTSNDDYKGKIDRQGNWKVSGDQDEKLLKLLSEFVMEPLKVAKKYGFATGQCCCCGKALTDPNSIAAGIGPICADKFF